MHSQCIVCQISIRYRDLEKSRNLGEYEKMKIMSDVLAIAKDFMENCLKNGENTCVPTMLATKLFRYMKKALNNPDPYIEEKTLLNKEALKLYENVKAFVLSGSSVEERLVKAIRFSIIGNLLDIGVLNYTPPTVEEIIEKALKMDIYGDLEKAAKILLNSKKVVVVLDNAGEAVFDRLLADVLRANGSKVSAIVKGGSFQNDMTIHDAALAELDKSFDEVIDSGTDASSIFLDELSEKARKAIDEAESIVFKGMANYEYVTEIENVIKKPIIYLLVAKCLPVSIASGIPLGKAGVVIHNIA